MMYNAIIVTFSAKRKGEKIGVQIINVGYHHCHDVDFYIDRPNGSGDYLALILTSSSIFTLNGEDVEVPANSFFLYPVGVPQYYRAVPQTPFSNDWVHFLFSEEKLEKFKTLNIPYETPIPMKDIQYLSFCIKCIACECYSGNLHRADTMLHYMELMFNKVSEQLHDHLTITGNSAFEMLSTIRNKIYSKPYEQRTIESTAHEVRMSKSNFQHLYKEQFGVSCMQDMIASRIEYAKWHLIETDLHTVAIAELCGYNNYTHFTRQFKAKTGMTPNEYRQLHRKTEDSAKSLSKISEK